MNDDFGEGGIGGGALLARTISDPLTVFCTAAPLATKLKYASPVKDFQIEDEGRVAVLLIVMIRIAAISV